MRNLPDGRAAGIGSITAPPSDVSPGRPAASSGEGPRRAPPGTGPVSRVAAIYDIHGNLPALEAVLEDVHRAGVDHVIAGGDVVPGPMPRETLERLMDLECPTQFIRGNGERAVLQQMSGEEPAAVPDRFRGSVRWVAQQLGPGHERLMASWPMTVRVEIAGLGHVLFCHATPGSDEEIFTRLTPDERVQSFLEGLDARVVVCGHTHMQFDRTVGATRVVNAGSVGMPFGEPVACWLLLGPDIRLRRTRYDLARAAERVRGTAYPQAEEFAATSILAPPSEAETLELFARAESGRA